jgi:hypothetical protein
MRAKRLILLAVVAVVVCAGFFCYRALLGPNHKQAITMRFETVSDKGFGSVPNPTFWITNHTGKELIVCLLGIETQANGIWRTCTNFPSRMPLFNESGDGSPLFIPPHAAVLSSPFGAAFDPPENCVWRVKASVEGKLGPAEVCLNAIRLRLLHGNTNFSLNSFRKNRNSIFAPGPDVVSEPVGAQ